MLSPIYLKDVMIVFGTSIVLSSIYFHSVKAFYRYLSEKYNDSIPQWFLIRVDRNILRIIWLWDHPLSLCLLISLLIWLVLVLCIALGWHVFKQFMMGVFWPYPSNEIREAAAPFLQIINPSLIDIGVFSIWITFSITAMCLGLSAFKLKNQNRIIAYFRGAVGGFLFYLAYFKMRQVGINFVSDNFSAIVAIAKEYNGNLPALTYEEIVRAKTELSDFVSYKLYLYILIGTVISGLVNGLVNRLHQNWLEKKRKKRGETQSTQGLDNKEKEATKSTQKLE